MTVPAAQMDNIKAEAITIEERSPVSYTHLLCPKTAG